MKKAIFIAAATAAVLYGCKKDDSLTLKTQEGGVQINQSTSTTTTTVTNQGKTLITYTVHVVDPTKAGKTSAAGLSGATVDLIHNNGTQSTATSNANGFATFTGLYKGDVNVDVSLTGFTNVHYSAILRNVQTNITGSTDLTENATTDIAIWPLTATVDGYVYGDYDDDGTPVGTASITDAGDRTQAITVNLDFNTAQPFNQPGTSGAIISSYIYPNRYSGVSATGGETGQFTISGLPAIYGTGSTVTLWTVPVRVASPFSSTSFEFRTTITGLSANNYRAGAKNFIGLFPLTRTQADF